MQCSPQENGASRLQNCFARGAIVRSVQEHPTNRNPQAGGMFLPTQGEKSYLSMPGNMPHHIKSQDHSSLKPTINDHCSMRKPRAMLIAHPIFLVAILCSLFSGVTATQNCSTHPKAAMHRWSDLKTDDDAVTALREVIHAFASVIGHPELIGLAGDNVSLLANLAEISTTMFNCASCDECTVALTNLNEILFCESGCITCNTCATRSSLGMPVEVQSYKTKKWQKATVVNYSNGFYHLRLKSGRLLKGIPAKRVRVRKAKK